MVIALEEIHSNKFKIQGAKINVPPDPGQFGFWIQLYSMKFKNNLVNLYNKLDVYSMCLWSKENNGEPGTVNWEMLYGLSRIN